MNKRQHYLQAMHIPMWELRNRCEFILPKNISEFLIIIKDKNLTLVAQRFFKEVLQAFKAVEFAVLRYKPCSIATCNCSQTLEQTVSMLEPKVVIIFGAIGHKLSLQVSYCIFDDLAKIAKSANLKKDLYYKLCEKAA